MIRIKAVDAQNILEVCALTTSHALGTAREACSHCNAISIAQANYHSELHPNAIYNNNVLVGFFLYQRAENQAETVTICRFMVDDQFRHQRLEEKAFEHILRGLKIQGVKNVILNLDNANENAKSLCLSFGFHLTGEMDKKQCRYELEL